MKLNKLIFKNGKTTYKWNNVKNKNQIKLNKKIK